MGMSELFNPQHQKVVVSGDMVELYQYEYPNYKKNLTYAQKVERRLFRKQIPRKPPRHTRTKQNIQRSKDNFRRMVRATLVRGSPAFATFTMVTVETIPVAYKEFSRFTTSLRRVYGRSVEWVAVPEFHKKNNRVHFHALIWGLPYETIQRERDARYIQFLWSCGWIDILASDGSPKLSSYLAKYLSKGMRDARLRGQKCYTASRGVMRPMLYKTETQIEVVISDFPEIVNVDTHLDSVEVDRTYLTQWLGRCRYRKIKIEL